MIGHSDLNKFHKKKTFPTKYCFLKMKIKP